MITLYYQLDNKMGLLVANVAQKTFLISISVISGGHFKFCPLEKMLTVLGANFLGMIPGTHFHHQNTQAEEWSWNWSI